MDNLTKNQVVLLVLLVSFVTSIATGIVTVTLINQAPPSVTQTINRVVEKIVSEKGENKNSTVFITQEDMVINIVKEATPSVVSVVATKDIPVWEQYYVNPFGESGGLFGDFLIPQMRQKGTEKKQVSSGTGFFVSEDGLLITNKHVVEDGDAQYSIITNDGKKYDAKILARDPFQDLAVLKVEGSGFKALELGSSDNLNIGQSVIAIGNALGEFKNTVSVGIISGLSRNITAGGPVSGPEELQGLIQTDAAINPGNSGGPLLDIEGRVIGINTAVAQSAENIGFALPINVAKRDVADAKQFNQIKYPYIGFRYKSVEKGLQVATGSAGESAIMKDSPAEKAGIKEGDIVMEFNGTKLDSLNKLSAVLSKHRVGDKIVLKIFRDNKEINVEIILGERP